MTYLIAIATIILQIALAVHAVRTRRPFIWVFLILLFPLMGSAIYIIAELIPEWDRTHAIQTWFNDIKRFLAETFLPR